MKKFISLLNNYLSNFWFILFIFTLGLLLIIKFDPFLLVMYFGRNGEFVAISSILLRLWSIFLLPLAAVSVLPALIIWLKDRAGNSYRGFSALILILLTLGTTFLIITESTMLDYKIKEGAFDVVLGNSSTADGNKNLYKTIQYNEKVTSETEIQTGKLSNIPAEIKNIYNKDNVTYLSIDILDRNSNFIPGKNSFFINTNKKTRDVLVGENTKVYICGPGSDNNITTADEQTETQGVLKYIKSLILLNEPAIYYFDIENDGVKTIYQQCLP